MSTPAQKHPPRIVRFFLALLLDETDLDEVDELFEERAERFGFREAKWAYRLELWWGLLGRLPGGGRRRERRASGEGGPRSGKGNRRNAARMLEETFRDLRIAGRRLAKAPGFTIATVAVLALGIGANLTAFSAFKMAVLTPPPFPAPERLVSVDLLRDQEGEPQMTLWSYPRYRLLEEWEGCLVDPVVSYRPTTAVLSGLDLPSKISLEMVSPGFFDLLGRAPDLGRGFLPEEADPGGEMRVTVLSHRFWQTRMGGDPNVVGLELQLNRERYRIVGVAPAGFRGLGREAELWIPSGAEALFSPRALEQPGNHMIRVVGRLRSPASLAAAKAQLGAIETAMNEVFPGDTYGVDARSLVEIWEHPSATVAVRLMGLVAGMLLLVACANLSGLLLVRAGRTERDAAVRKALGASRRQLMRAALTESLLISSLGGLAGIGVSHWGTSMMTLLWPDEFMTNPSAGLLVGDMGAMAVDGRTLAFALLVVLGTTILVGMIPALRASGAEASAYLRAGSGGTRQRRSFSGLDAHSALVGLQVSLALILLFAASLMGTSVRKLLAVDEGFRSENLLTFDFSQPQGVEPLSSLLSMDEWEARVAAKTSFDQALHRRITALPGVEEMTVGCRLLQGWACGRIAVTRVEGRPDYEPRQVGWVIVGDGYFELMDIPAIRGRILTPEDGLGGEPAVVLSELAASTLFPQENPIGREIDLSFGAPGRRTMRVVGVVGEVRHMSIDQDPVPAVYFSSRELGMASHVIVRTTANPSGVVGSIQEAVKDVDQTVALSNIQTVEEIVGRGIADRRMILTLLALISAITILLVVVGTWGVVANAVVDRTREIGIRLAVGATHGTVVMLVLRRVLGAAGLGITIGLAGALLGTRLIETFLWQVDSRDPSSLAGSVVALAAIVIVAGYLPARSASRIGLGSSLRAE